jgi:hypothetical protein
MGRPCIIHLGLPFTKDRRVFRELVLFLSRRGGGGVVFTTELTESSEKNFISPWRHRSRREKNIVLSVLSGKKNSVCSVYSVVKKDFYS